MQAEAMSLPIVSVRSSWETYEAEFKKTLSGLKGRGVEAGNIIP
jgi:diphthamide synthase (EF-2-diphthine--ammonia ligase)